jgi:NAD(P)-dependent dehydrogenase (short-subunit alcohol dehydrogenase family)
MTILIAGGTKGIGFAIAERLARPGTRLVLAYRADETAAAAAHERLSQLGALVQTVQADIGEIAGARRAVEASISSEEEQLHIIHSAAMIYPTNLLNADLDLFTTAVRTNGLSLLYLVRQAVPLLARGSSIVFISSAGSRVAQPNYAALGVGKALAESLMRYLVPELAPRGVRINAVAPGLVATDSVAGMVGGQEAAERVFERAARTNPSGRMSRNSDYTSVVQFLLSPEAEFVQGQVIHVNGGSYVPP